jgi:hypothetical protein
MTTPKPLRLFGPAIALILSSSVPASGQATSAAATMHEPPRIGEEILVTYDTDPYARAAFGSYRNTITLEFYRIDERGRLIGRTGGRYLAIDTAAIRTVRRQIGVEPASAPAMVLGSAAGFAAGFVIGALAHSDGAPGGASSSANSGLAAGVLIGAPAGALIAWLSSRSRPIYEEVGLGPVTPSVTLGLSGRVGLSMSVATR